MEQLEGSHIARGNATGPNCNTLAGIQKVKHIPIIQFSHSTPRYLCKKRKAYVCTKPATQIFIASSFIFNSRQVGTTQMNIQEQVKE